MNNYLFFQKLVVFSAAFVTAMVFVTSVFTTAVFVATSLPVLAWLVTLFLDSVLSGLFVFATLALLGHYLTIEPPCNVKDIYRDPKELIKLFYQSIERRYEAIRAAVVEKLG